MLQQEELSQACYEIEIEDMKRCISLLVKLGLDLQFGETYKLGKANRLGFLHIILVNIGII